MNKSGMQRLFTLRSIAFAGFWLHFPLPNRRFRRRASTPSLSIAMDGHPAMNEHLYQADITAQPGGLAADTRCTRYGVLHQQQLDEIAVVCDGR